ncbi:MAG: putative zinc-binding metallopeptidase [Proteobacteria bacterium]|nr:putative zinc-binding metallopeptidase [Pseudomonadota bacterium]
MADRRRGTRSPLSRLSREALLDVRLCDLGVRIEESPLEPRLERLGRELEAAGLSFRPYAWLSTDWFTPRGVTGFAIPFFLAHTRLAALERHHMLEVEGGKEAWCMKLLRHEAAHALDNAYRLSRRKSWREHFGRMSEPYRQSYVPQPGSRDYVDHLYNWYAQSHPMEDFAETFAVWLRPGNRWRTRYAGWPALRKLEYVDELMREIGRQRPPVRTRERTDSLPKLRMTLREYYRRKQYRYGMDGDDTAYDRGLSRLFADAGSGLHASTFLRKHRLRLRRRVARHTGQAQFVVDDVLRDWIARTRQLRLKLAASESETLQDAAVLLTVHTMRMVRIRHREYLR